MSGPARTADAYYPADADTEGFQSGARGDDDHAALARHTAKHRSRPDTLLTLPDERYCRRSRLLLYLGGSLLLAVLIATIIILTNEGSASALPRNVILLIPDGTGPATLALARVCSNASLTLDSILVGAARTYSSDAHVTDSAASATAYACGEKSYNGAIGVDSQRRPLGTLHEAAKAQGLVAGLIATSRLTHATPASFSSHIDERAGEDGIATQQILKNLDFAIGGGARYFLASRRTDGRDLVANLTGQGYSVLLNRPDYDAWKLSSRPFPVFGLLADDHMEFEIDRPHVVDGGLPQPSLTDVAGAVLDKLHAAASAGGPGFIAMIEGSRVDHAGHSNDPATHFREAVEFDRTVALALEFRNKFPNTLVISVADHETGGLGLGRDGVYNFYPEVLNAVQRSSEWITKQIVAAPGDAASLVMQYAGTVLSSAQLETINSATAQRNKNMSAIVATVVANAVSVHAGVAWTTVGHTGVDVGIYAAGPDHVIDQLRAVRENTDINHVIADYLGLDLLTITAELRGQRPIAGAWPQAASASRLVTALLLLTSALLWQGAATL